MEDNRQIWRTRKRSWFNGEMSGEGVVINKWSFGRSWEYKVWRLYTG